MVVLAWMSGTLASFSLMAIGVRELSGDIPVFQMLLIRSVVGFLLVSNILFFTGRVGEVQSRKLPLHVLRNMFHFAGQYGWFVGIGLLPLAEVFALEFTVPIWTAIIAAIFLNERVSLRKVFAIGLGLIGVLLIVRPGHTIIDSASLLVLVAAVCYAVAHTSTKALVSSDSPLVILFYMCFLQLPIALVLALYSWAWPDGIQWLWLIAISLTALSAHFCTVKAMQHAEATTVVTIDFLRLPLIAIIGMILYQEPFEVSILIGGSIMLLGNVVLLRRDSSTAR